MADSTRKTPENVPGSWFVDDECIACELCIQLAPLSFKMADDGDHAFVCNQPAGQDEITAADDAAEQCPVEAIGNE
jgi:ferredoxin